MFSKELWNGAIWEIFCFLREATKSYFLNGPTIKREGGGGRGQAIKKNRTFGIFFLIYRSGKQKYKEIFNFIQNIDVSR